MTKHRQVPVAGFGFECDEEIADLVTLLNVAGIRTLLSCQDNNGRRGTVRRVWIEVFADDLLHWLRILDHPYEAARDLESLSNRIGNEYEPDDWREFRANRQWHYDLCVDRSGGVLAPLTVSVRFPYTDLPAVTSRMRQAVRMARPIPSP